MLYLEDYVELIEHLPSDLRDRFSDMRDMDLQIQSKMETLNNRVKDLFDKCTIKKGKYSGADQAYEEVRNEYYKVLESADEKVQMANQIYDLVDRHLRKLDQELSKFKMELEADNAGITEVLEQRSLELDNPVALQRGSGRERRRTHTAAQPSSSTPSSSTTSSVNNGDGMPPDKRIKLETLPGTDSINVSAQATDDNTSHSDGKTFSQYVDPNVTVPSSDQYEPIEGSSGLPKQSHSLSSSVLDSDSVSTSEQIVRRTSVIKENSRSIEVTQRLSDFDGLNVDSVEIGGDHGSDSSLNSFIGPAAQRPSRTKKQTTKAAAWVQERLQAEARHEQRKKDSVPSTSSTQESGEEAGGVEVVGESSSTSDWNCDPNEPRYCLCNQVSYGEMVGCDNEKCTIEWFHYGCVGLTEAPKGKWYCPQCTQTMKRRKR